MMKYLISIFFILLFSCENNNEPTLSTIIESETTLKTDSLSSFSIEAGKAFDYPIKEDISEDFFLGVARNELGHFMAIIFISDTESLAYLYPTPEFHFNSLDTAQMIYDTLSILDDDLFYDWGIGVDKGMILALRTKDNKYGILMITEAKYYKDTIENHETYKALVSFKWKYQTNGSRSFKN